MLVEEEYVVMKAEQQQEFDEEEGEGDYFSRNRESLDPDRMTPTLSRMPPPLYAAVFGPNGPGFEGQSDVQDTVIESRRLVGFMVYLGVRASADEVATVREEREEYEAEEAE